MMIITFNAEKFSSFRKLHTAVIMFINHSTTEAFATEPYNSMQVLLRRLKNYKFTVAFFILAGFWFSICYRSVTFDSVSYMNCSQSVFI